MHDCLISFGANLGHSEQTYEQVVEQLDHHAQIQIVARSQLLVTRPIGGPAGQNDYHNACLRVHTAKNLESFFLELQSMEQRLGRRRRQRWGSRKVDLDILLFDQMDSRMNSPQGSVVVPHPRMSFRRFVLQPANRIAPEMIHPPSGLSIAQLNDHLDHRPNRIVLVADAGQAGLAAALIKQCHEDQAYRDWDFELVSELHQLEAFESATKLVVYSAEHDSNPVVARARRFAGATLNLGHWDGPESEVEVTAAIHSMQSL